MRNSRVCIVILALMICAPGWAAKTTIDPNVSAIKQSSTSSSDEIDARMSQKISYDSGYKRLHSVIEDLSRISGVKITCGQNSADWGVRDIPVVVCVKDMALGKLLRAIADATHTKITAKKTASEPAKTYRIYRRPKEKSEIDTVLKDKHEASLARIKWKWNALAAYGKGNEIKGYMASSRDTWLIGKLIASTGPGSDTKLLDGETFRFRGSDPAARDIIRELCEKERKISLESSGRSAGPLEDKDVEAATLEIRVQDSGESGSASLTAYLAPIRLDDKTQSMCSMDSAISAIEVLGEMNELGTFKDKGLELPPRPKGHPLPTSDCDIDNPAMVNLSKDEQWKQAPLNTGIDVKKPDGVIKPAFADLIKAVATASGCNIVVEDFASHLTPSEQQVENLFTDKTNISEIFHRIRIGGLVNYTWFFDSKANLLVGWACDGGVNWREMHKNLLSEEYLTSLKSKINGEGVGIDDAIAMLTATEDARSWWIVRSNDLSCLKNACYCQQTAMWLLYSALKPEDKALAKSKDGLALAKFDSVWLAGFFRALRTSQICSYTFHSNETARKEAESEQARIERATSDAHVISTMVMRLVETVVDTSDPEGKTHYPPDPPAALGLVRYDLVINYKMDDEEYKMTVPYSSGLKFPIRSTERETEIIKAASQG